MVQTFETLSFEAIDQSLWQTGGAESLSFTTGNLLIFETGEQSFDFDADLGFAGVSGTVFSQFRVGFEAYATLGKAGSFDARYTYSLAVDHTAGVDLSDDSTANQAVFEFSDASFVSGALSSEGAEVAPKAGFDFVVGGTLGVRNGEWYALLKDGTFDFTLINDFEFRHPLFELDPQLDEYEFESGFGITLTGSLPKGADTEFNAGQSNATTVVSYGRADDPFVTLRADVDEIVTTFVGSVVSKIPVAGQVFDVVTTVLFFDEEFDLGDYLPFLPDGAAAFSFTVLDVSARLDGWIDETLTLDLVDDTPISVLLRADNGTPDDLTDDTVLTDVELGGSATFDLDDVTLADGIGTNRITAYYDLGRTNYTRDIEVAFTGSFNITFLKSSLQGDWVPDSLAERFTFGPLWSLDIPEGRDENGDPIGYEIGAISVYDSDFDLVEGRWNASGQTYTNGAFSQATRTYDVLVVDDAPNDWNPELPDAVQQVYAYREALQVNLAAAVQEIDFLWSEPQDVQNLPASNNGSAAQYHYSAADKTRVWLGNADSEVWMSGSGLSNDDGHIVVRPSFSSAGVAADTSLDVAIMTTGSGSFGTAEYFDGTTLRPIFQESATTHVNVDEGIVTFSDMLDILEDPDALIISYRYGDSVFKSRSGASVAGQAGDDVIVHMPFAKGGRGVFYDGGAGEDIFLANLALDGDEAISFDTGAGNLSTAVSIGGGVTLRNFERFILRTGAGDDFLTSGLGKDYFETGAGDDYLRLTADTESDIGYMGAGDDIIVVEHSALTFDGRNVLQGPLDDIDGGSGMDVAVLRAVDDPTLAGYNAEYGMRGSSLQVQRISGSFEEVTVRHTSDTADLVEALRIHDGGAFFGTSAITDRGFGSAGTESVEGRLLYDLPETRVWFNDSVEKVSFIGADSVADVAIFNGGLEYFAGEGVYAGTNIEAPDLLLADFGAYADRMGVTEGITFLAEDRISGSLGFDAIDRTLGFGDARFDGWERLGIAGTDHNDILLGGKYGDVLDGGAGNDVLDGGEFDPFDGVEFVFSVLTETVITNEQDSIFGGAGSDVISWSDDGADRLFGGRREGIGNFAFDFAEYTDTLIVQSEEDSLRLEYGLWDASFTTRSIYSTTSSLNNLAAAITRVQEDDSFAIDDQRGTGLRFGNTLGDGDDPWMQYLGFERINISASDDQDDLLLFDGRGTYLAGEGNGDRDTFGADFSHSDFAENDIGVSLRVIEDDTTGQQLGNGVFVRGAERLVIKGGSGDDQFIGGLSDDYLDGGAGNDLIYGGDDHNLFNGDDDLRGGDGDDNFLWFADGNDTVLGGDGNDTLTLAARDDLGVSWGALNDSSDLLFFSLDADSNRVALNTAFENLNSIDLLQVRAARDDGTADVLDIREVEALNVAGHDDSDDLVILMGQGVVYGGDRVGDADLLMGDLSDEDADILIFADGRDDVSLSGSGFDAVNGAFLGDDDEIYDIGTGATVGGFERLFLRTGSGNDTLVGGTLADRLEGGDGNDVIATAGGGTELDRDQANGGTGDDLLIYSSGFAAFDGGFNTNDLDTLQIELNAAVATGITLRLLDDAGDQMGDLITASDNDRASLSALMDLVPSRAGEVNSSTQADALELIHADGTLIYRDFENITFTGTHEDDVLVAPFRYGTLFGGAGDDLLVSGIGLDLLVGGEGHDTYVFDSGNGGFGIDLIAQETAGGATLYFNDKSLADLTFSAFNGDDLRIDTSGGQITVRNYFEAGGNGFDFTFDLLDYSGSLDLSGTADITAGGAQAAGLNLVGTSGDDDLRGQVTDGADSYAGGSGNDVFAGSAGEDIFAGSIGVDAVSYYASDAGGVTVDLQFHKGSRNDAEGDTFAGIESVLGTRFGDALSGDAQNNVLFGAEGNDTLAGRLGDDTLSGEDDSDILIGDGGDDVLVGGDGADALYGGADNDTLRGGAGDDTLEGGDGDDVLEGGAGNDSVLGGTGADIYAYGVEADTSPADAGVDFFNGGTGVDMLDLSAYVEGVVQRDNVISSGDVQRIGYTQLEQFVLTAYDDVVSLREFTWQVATGNGNDRVELTRANAGSTLLGGVGNDEIVDLTTGTGRLLANFSDSNQQFGVNNPLISAGTYQDKTGSVHQVTGFEVISGTQYDDLFQGGDAGETITDGDGADYLSLAGGNDTVIVTVTDGVQDHDSYFGGEGFDTIDYSAATGGLFVHFAANRVTDRGDANIAPDTGVNQDDHIYDFEHVITGTGNDLVWLDFVRSYTVETGAGDDVVLSLSKSDRVIAGQGNDTYNDSFFAPGTENYDLLDYRFIDGGVNIVFSGGGSGTATGLGIDTDTFSNFERIVLSKGDDVFAGSNKTDYVIYAAERGEGGFDFVNVGGGTDDVLDFLSFDAAIEIDLLREVQVTTRDGDSMASSNGPVRDIVQFKGVERLNLTNYSDRILGTNGADTFEGQGGNDTFVGRNGADAFLGGTGSNTVDYSAEIGGAGVTVDLSAVVLGSTAGIDTFGARDSYTDIHNAIGTAQADSFFGSIEDNLFSGGAGADTVFGGAGANLLIGGEGADVVVGGLDDDLIFGGDGRDTLAGGTGNDAIDGESSDDVLEGDAGDDSLQGGAGNDTLRGGEGADLLIGGQGSDVIYVDDVADNVVESRSWDGTDIVIASVDFRMGSDHIEDLELTGTAVLGAGNGLMNLITGNALNNTLDGGKNNDTLIGGNGNDTYLARAPGDLVVESETGGSADVVKAFRAYALTDHVEKLFLQTLRNAAGEGVSGINGIGNSLGNTIVGNPFDNVIVGRQGKDTLKGQAGADTFVFDRAFGADNVDRIIDFNTLASDTGDTLKIKLSLLGASGLSSGALDANHLALGATAGDADDRFIFDVAAGQLWYDVDGTGAQNQTLVATFEQDAIVTADQIELF
jgi:Ca2+-binding RTX toxin-like protein